MPFIAYQVRLEYKLLKNKTKDLDQRKIVRSKFLSITDSLRFQLVDQSIMIFYNNKYLGLIVGADIVEYNPERDVDFLTASVAAKIMKEIAGKIIISQEMHKKKIMDPLYPDVK